MLVDFNIKNIYQCVHYEFFLPATMFYLLNYNIKGKLQDQNQGRQ